MTRIFTILSCAPTRSELAFARQLVREFKEFGVFQRSPFHRQRVDESQFFYAHRGGFPVAWLLARPAGGRFSGHGDARRRGSVGAQKLSDLQESFKFQPTSKPDDAQGACD